MSTSIASVRPGEVWVPLAEVPLDEARWQAWQAEGRAQDRRRNAMFRKGVKWASITGLLAALGNWPHPSPYDVLVRFVVAAGALATMVHALRSRDYLIATVFGALVVLYNPLAPTFRFSGQWQIALLVASTIPFAASLAWREPRLVPHV